MPTKSPICANCRYSRDATGSTATSLRCKELERNVSPQNTCGLYVERKDTKSNLYRKHNRMGDRYE